MSAKPATRKRTTRKPSTPCSECGNPAELGTICNACTEAINQHELLYVDGIRGNVDARKALKKLSPTERQRIVPTVLSEDDIDAFVKKGIITGRHQATVRTVRLAGKSKEITVSQSATAKLAPKTSTRKSRPASTRTSRKAEPAASPTPKAIAKPLAKVTGTDKPKQGSTLTAAQVASDAGLDARKFRAFLRKSGLKPTTKAQFASAVKKFKSAK